MLHLHYIKVYVRSDLVILALFNDLAKLIVHFEVGSVHRPQILYVERFKFLKIVNNDPKDINRQGKSVTLGMKNLEKFEPISRPLGSFKGRKLIQVLVMIPESVSIKDSAMGTADCQI